MNAKRIASLSVFGIMALCALLMPMDAMADGDVASIGEAGFASLQDAFDAAADGDTITLLQNTDITEIDIDVPVTLDLNGYTVTASTPKAFEVYADATIKNGTINAPKRCVDTRTAVDLVLEDLELNATGSSVQPITIGGSDHGTEVTVTGCTAEYEGNGDDYAMIVWVESDITIEDSTLSAWASLYMKEDSSGSTVNVINSDLTGTNYGGTYEFGTVVFEGNDIELTVDGNSTFTSVGDYQPLFQFSGYDGSDEDEDPDYDVEPNLVTLLDGHFDGVLYGGQEGEGIVLSVEGGTFTEDPSDYVPFGFKAVDNGTFWAVELDETAYEAMADGEYFFTLAEAVDAADEGDTVTLLKDIVLQGKSLTIDADEAIILDLNGFELSAAFAEGKASATIINKGDLRIEDNSADESGVITTVASNPDTEWAAGFPAYANNTITNCGILTVAGGTVENSTSGGACYAIDNNSGTADAIVTVEDGTVIHRANNFAIRQFANSTRYENSVIIEGGEVTGRRAVWMQLPGSKGDEKKASLTVTGGTLTSTDEEYNMAVYSYTYGDSFAQTYVIVEGGTFNGDIALTGGSLKTPVENVEISGGTFNGAYGVYSYGEMTGYITGGRYLVAPTSDMMAEGYVTYEEGGYWVVCTKGEVPAFPGASDAPSVPDEDYTAPAPSTGESDGWKEITDEIETSDEIVIDMNGGTTVPGKVIDTVAGTDTTVTFETGKATWQIEGEDIPEDASVLSLRVSTSDKLPAAAKEAAEEADDALSVKVSKTFESNGIKASLTVETDKANAGKAADIYALNADGELEFVTSVPVNKDGSVTLPVEDASQYVITVSDEGALEEGWQKNDRGEWIYGTEDGTAATGWYKDGGIWYHSDEHGIMETGWFTDTDGKEYYLNESGAMRTGWLYEKGEWYFFGTSGAKVESGWVLSGGKWYYMQADGTMLTSGVTPDGYRVGADGVWTA